MFYCKCKSNVYNHEHLWPWGSGFFWFSINGWFLSARMFFRVFHANVTVAQRLLPLLEYISGFNFCCNCGIPSLLRLWATIHGSAKESVGTYMPVKSLLSFRWNEYSFWVLTPNSMLATLFLDCDAVVLKGSIVELNGAWMLQPCFFKIWDMLAVLQK